MTNSAIRPDKRERLARSAAELMYSQGVHRTTLGQVAEHADVPPGNVYYYFKTFDDLVDAVIEYRKALVRANLDRLEKRRGPKSKLKGLAAMWMDSAEMVAENGCPLGSLASELSKTPDHKAEHAADLLRIPLDFIERQFDELGRRDSAALATTMTSRIQGAALLANSLADSSILKAEVRRIERWLDTLE